MISDLARQALSGGGRPSGEEGESFHGFDPLPRRGPPVTSTLIDELREDGP